MIRITLLLILCASVCQAQTDTIAYTRKDVMIPMRDGVKLNTRIFVSGIVSPNKVAYVADMAKEGYIFAYQDIRGRYKSEGKFEMQRFMRDRKDKKAIDESTDTYDAIEWMIRNVSGNNGNVGMYGISYGGWTTMMGTIDPHPALKAVSEQASPSDMWMGDDFHHNGAFRLSYAFEYAYMEEATKEDAHFPFDRFDTYDWYLKLGPLSNVNEKYFHGKIPSWNDFVNHPDYDDFWKKQSMPYRIENTPNLSSASGPSIPNLHVAGYWDQEDWYGPLKAYEVLEKNDKQKKNFIVIGPWNHGGWGRMDGDKLGNIEFGLPTGQQFRTQIQTTWFAHYLKGKSVPPTPESPAMKVADIGGGSFGSHQTAQTRGRATMHGHL